MTDEQASVGEAREAAARRKRIIIIAGLFLFGLITGIYTGTQDVDRALFSSEGHWPPALSVTICISYIVALIGGSLLLRSSMDELQRHSEYMAISFAGGSYLLVYPLWFVLWKGDFVREPVHWAIFILFVVIWTAAKLFYRFR